MAAELSSEEFLAHRAIARWISTFFDETAGVKAYLEGEIASRKPQPSLVGSPYQEPDSDSLNGYE